MLSLLLACSRPTPAEAWRVAAAGGEGATEACAYVEVEARAECRAFAATTVDACDAIDETPWRGECYFLLAEASLVAGDEDEAVRRCTRAGPFADDCARHLWNVALRRGDAHGSPFLSRLAEAFPGGVEFGTGASTEEARARLFLKREDIDLDDCATRSDRDACETVAAEVLADRWRRRAVANPLVDEVLCEAAARGELPDLSRQSGLRNLSWTPSPSLDAAMRALQVERCPRDVSAPPPASTPRAPR